MSLIKQVHSEISLTVWNGFKILDNEESLYTDHLDEYIDCMEECYHCILSDRDQYALCHAMVDNLHVVMVICLMNDLMA